MNELVNISTTLDSVRNECTDEYGRPNGYEFWYARDLMQSLGYKNWRDFNNCIQRAIVMCNMSGIPENQHFADIVRSRNVRSTTPTGGEFYKTYTSEDYQLSRYGCYLVAINGNTPECAYAQAYFLTRAREMELMIQHYNQLRQLEIREECRITDNNFSGAMNSHGVSSQGIGRVKSKGDEALFGGFNTKEMKDNLRAKQNQSLYDILDPRVAAARRLAAELTTGNINEQNLQGEKEITEDHMDNNDSVRMFLISKGITPEYMPAVESSKTTQRYITSEESDLANIAGMYTSPILFIQGE